MDDIDKILRRAARGSYLSQILDFLPGVVIAIILMSLLWTCSYGPLNSDFSNIKHGDTVKVISGAYRGVIERANTGSCILPWHIMVSRYSCKAWWELEKVN